MKALDSMKACESMLAEIEAELLLALPQAVRQRNFQESAYAVLICYLDLTAQKHVPYPTVLWERHRAKRVADRDAGDIWFLPEISSAFACVMPESESLSKHCELAYDFLTRNLDQEEDQMILPFRKMIYRVSLTLNQLDWSTILPVTDDFIVMASDWNGSWVHEDARQSVPFSQQERLKKKGLFFNPGDLAEPQLPAGSPILEMEQRPAEEQLPYWTDQLESLIQGNTCDATRAKWGSERILQSLCKLEEVGGDAILRVLEKFADLAESGDGNVIPHSAIMQEALNKVQVSARRDNATEKRLWALFDRTINANKGRDTWGRLPEAIARCIQWMFRHKYNYWVVCDSGHRLTNLDQISEQRKAKAPQ